MKQLTPLAALLLGLSVAATPALAQVGTSDSSSFTIQNLGASLATVTVSFYEEDGTGYTPDPIQRDGTPNPFTIDPGASSEIFVPAVPGDQLPDGSYSTVIESTEPVVVIANLVDDGGHGDGAHSWSYSGLNTGGTTTYLPEVKHDYSGWNTRYTVHNVDPANAADVNVTYSDQQGNTTATVTATIPPNAPWNVDLQAQGYDHGLPSGFNGSAVVSSSTSTLTSIANQHIDGEAGGFRGHAGGSGVTLLPLVERGYGVHTNIRVQNTGTSSARVEIYFYDSGGQSAGSGHTTVPLNGAQAVDLDASGNDMGLPPQYRGAAMIVSDMSPVAVTVKLKTDCDKACAYSGIPSQDATRKVFLPALKKDHFGANTSFTCKNASRTGETVITYNYGGLGCPSGSCSRNLPMGASTTVDQRDDLDSSSGLYGATVQSSDEPVVCIVQEFTGSSFQCYEGINVD